MDNKIRIEYLPVTVQAECHDDQHCQANQCIMSYQNDRAAEMPHQSYLKTATHTLIHLILFDIPTTLSVTDVLRLLVHVYGTHCQLIYGNAIVSDNSNGWCLFLRLRRSVTFLLGAPCINLLTYLLTQQQTHCCGY